MFVRRGGSFGLCSLCAFIGLTMAPFLRHRRGSRLGNPLYAWDAVVTSQACFGASPSACLTMATTVASCVSRAVLSHGHPSQNECVLEAVARMARFGAHGVHEYD
jgi:hypothetical protein